MIPHQSACPCTPTTAASIGRIAHFITLGTLSLKNGKGVLFVLYEDTLKLLTVADAFRVCEDVYRMQANDRVVYPTPLSFKLDVAEEFNNHWHVKAAFLKDIPATGVRF